MNLRKCAWASYSLWTMIFLALSAAAKAAAPRNSIPWTAQWIWPSTSAIATHQNQFILFRKTFTLPQAPGKAQLAIFADSRYRLFVNGAYIGQGPARAPARWSYYDVFDVASKLRPGLNAIAVEVRWYGQGMAWYEPPVVRSRFASRSHGALLCQLNAGEGAGETTIKTDATWKATEDHAWEWDTPESRVEDGRGGGRGRSVSHPRSSNRTCGFPASGSPTGVTMKHTDQSFASPYSSLGSFRSTTVFAGLTPITGPRFLREHPEVRTLPSAGITRLQRYYDPLRVPAGPPSLPRASEFASARAGVPPLAQTTFPACRAHYPGGPGPVRASVASRPVRPSPLFRRVGVHDFTFEACSSFTRVTACRVAQPPEVAFVTRLRPGPLPDQAACQLPDLPTTIWVGLSPTSDLRRWGALNDLGDIEVYHADRVVKGWTEPQFDDSGWIPVSVTRSVWGLTSPPEEPYTHLAPRPMAYPLEREMTPAKVVQAGVFSNQAPRASFFRGGNPLAMLGKAIASEHHTQQASILSNPQALTGTSAVDYAEIQPAPAGQTPYVILDMGREMDGYLQFSIESSRPARINIGWSEMMEHGDITADEPGGDYVAQYFVAPGSERWTLWGWHALRFVELSFPNLSAPLHFHVSLRFSTANLNHAGSFASSSALLTKLWQMGAYTWQLCTLDGTMDCPTREQHQWLGDGEIELHVNSVADGNLDIARKFLLDASRDQWRDGGIPMVSDMGGNTSILIDDYVFSYINAVQEYYLQTGDKDFVLRVYPNVERAMMWFQGFRQPDGLLGPMPYWVFLDWSNPDKQGESSILNALYAHTLDNAAQLAALAGDHYHAQIFRKDSARVHAIFNQRFWDPARGLYVDAWDHGRQSDRTGQLASADAILFGFAPSGRIPGILAKITDPSRVRLGGYNPATGQFRIQGAATAPGQAIIQAQTYGMFFVLETLGEHGDTAAVRRYIEKLWGPMAAVGNDTFWENFIQRTGTSCHAWSAAPTYFLSSLILGVRPTKPGYSQYAVAPHPAGLEWAKGAVSTVHGAITVDWKWEGGQAGTATNGSDPPTFTLHLHNPSGEIAHIALPERNGKAPSSVTLNGKHASGPLWVRNSGDYRVEAHY